MEIKKTPLEGLFILEPKVYGDSRGYFLESYSRRVWSEMTGQDLEFVQDNQSLSRKGTLRGLHFQHPPHSQGKLIRVIRGAIWDVAVDIRRHSPTYGQWYGLTLSGDNFRQLYIPPGFAHGFLTLEDDSIVSYKCTAYYHPQAEDGILWNDPDLNISWETDAPLLSEKDTHYGSLALFNTPF